MASSPKVEHDLIIRRLLRPCPICDSSEGEVVHSQEFATIAELGNRESVEIVACTLCGFAFSDLPVKQDEIDTSYAEHSRYADTKVHGGAAGASPIPPEAPWDLDRLQGTASYLAGVIEDRSIRVLDAGCATGSLLGFMHDRGFSNLVGLDPSPAATEIASRLHRVTAIPGSLVTPPLGIGRFGLVILSHVLEHIGDVQGAVKAIRGLVAERGLVYLEVPDAARYVDHLVAPFHDFNTEHINHFSPSTLLRLMAAAGFSELAIERKVVMCAPKFTYPAVYGLWRREDAVDGTLAPIERNVELVEAIKSYVDASHAMTGRIDQSLRAQLDITQPVVLWGAGQLALRLLRNTVLAELPIQAIVDTSSQKQGLHVSGHVVQAPEAVRPSDAPIVITSVHSADAIESAIRRDFGLTNPVIKLAPQSG